MDLTTQDSRAYLHLDYDRAVGVGIVRPRIQITLKARTAQEALAVTRGELVASLSLDNELLGTSPLTFLGALSTLEERVFFEVEVGRHALHYIQERLRGPSLTLTLRLSGLMWVRDSTPREERRTQSHVDFGEETIVPVDTSRTSGGSAITIARSDVYTQLLEPVGVGSYILMEMPIPPIRDPTRWRPVIGHLDKAQVQWALGNDAAVFSNCHAALESCTVAASVTDPKDLLAGIEDDHKRDGLNALVVKTKAYLNSGRHVSKQAGSTQHGEFAVNHQDAEFALAQTRIVVAYLAKLLAV